MKVGIRMEEADTKLPISASSPRRYFPRTICGRWATSSPLQPYIDRPSLVISMEWEYLSTSATYSARPARAATLYCRSSSAASVGSQSGCVSSQLPG